MKKIIMKAYINIAEIAPGEVEAYVKRSIDVIKSGSPKNIIVYAIPTKKRPTDLEILKA